MQFTGQNNGGTANSASLLARKCNWLTRTCIMNMRNATCVRTQTSKVPTWVALLFISYSMLLHLGGTDDHLHRALHAFVNWDIWLLPIQIMLYTWKWYLPFHFHILSRLRQHPILVNLEPGIFAQTLRDQIKWSKLTVLSTMVQQMVVKQ